jgi:hypothetical protein
VKVEFFGWDVEISDTTMEPTNGKEDAHGPKVAFEANIRVQRETYHIETGGGVHLDKAVEIAEEDGNGQEDEVDWIADVVA